MNSRIESGTYELVESNMIIMDSIDSQLTIHLNVDGTSIGKINVQFTSEEENEESAFSTKIENGELFINCINFNNTLGTGTKEAIEIGRIQGKLLKMQLWVYMLDKMYIRKVEYSIFKEQ